MSGDDLHVIARRVRIAGANKKRAIVRVHIDAERVRAREFRWMHVIDEYGDEQDGVVRDQVCLGWAPRRKRPEQRRGYRGILASVLADRPMEFLKERFIAC